MPSPSISVIIPTHNRPTQLARCLAALARSDYPPGRPQVIVVDDGSDSSPEPVVQPFRAMLDLVLLRQANAGPAAARNTGAQRAAGELLAFTDDDCLPAPGWVAALVARYVACPDALLGGRTLNALPENACSAASQHLVDYLYAYGERTGCATRFFAGNSLAIPATHFRTLGGFDVTYTRTASEDRDLCYRWLCAGLPLLYVPEAVVSHDKPLTLGRFLRQHHNYGRGARQFHRACAARGAPLRFGPLTFYLGLVTHAFRACEAGGATNAAILAGLLLLSQVAHTLGYLHERLSPRRPTGAARGAQPWACPFD